MKNIPVIAVSGKSLAEAYETALISLYGKDIQAAKERLFDRMNDMPFEEHTMPFNDPFIREMYDSAEPSIIQKIKEFDERH